MNSTKILFRTFALLLVSPFFMAGFCSKDDAVAIPTNATQYFTYDIMGIKGQVSSPTDSLAMTTSSNKTTFFGNTVGSSVTANYRLAFPGTTVGSYQLSECLIYISGHYFVSTATPITINVNSFGAAGSYVTGTYAGEIKDSTSGKIYTASGDFKIKHW